MESLERFLSELEMRLQLGAEEVEASLSECSGAGLRRVPFALQEVARLRGDVGALQVSARIPVIASVKLAVKLLADILELPPVLIVGTRCIWRPAPHR
jgi:hypothetical protein